ncbi:MAG: carboxylating nicotinate-nucleotide diphosphorylase [Verrucomicrobiota bacterium]|jgi:nicotinate-nucleotide pyrophosphorylase (carboxylating)
MMNREWMELVRTAIREDVGAGDVTSIATLPAGLTGQGRIEARQSLVIAGVEIAAAVFQEIDPGLELLLECTDGDQLEAGDRVMTIRGSAISLLTAERTALNFLQHLSGIATTTRSYVERVAGTEVAILDTRKTVPGLRTLAKYAVRVGGGRNHRIGLFDQVLIKDNHLAMAPAGGEHPVAWAVRRAKADYPELVVEVEVEAPETAEIAAAAGADIILLDNMDCATLRESVRRVAGRSQTEASGGVDLTTVRAIAETGVDMISVGALTHSIRAADLAMEIDTRSGA